jgi:hypothetical protein
MGDLADKSRRWAPTDEISRIALVGFKPDPGDPRLQPDNRFRLEVHHVGSRPSLADTELAVWLRAACPRLALRCVPLDKDSPAEVLAGAITWAARPDRWGEASGGGPAAIYIPSNLMGSPEARESRALSDALADCWRALCLPLTIEQGPSPASVPGILSVCLVPDDAVGRPIRDDPTLVEKVANRAVMLWLPQHCLDGSPDGPAELRKAAAYVTLVAALLPAQGRTALMERAARLTLSSPIRWTGREGYPPHRLLDLWAASGRVPSRCFEAFGRTFAWDELFEGSSIIDHRERSRDPQHLPSLVLAAADDSASLRHILAAAQAAGARPVYLARPVGLIYFRPIAGSSSEARERAIRILSTQVGRRGQGLFRSIAADTLLGPDLPIPRRGDQKDTIR